MSTDINKASIVSTQNRVESPFIIVQIGKYTFGNCANKENKQSMSSILNVTYPNYMDALNIVKINGAVNTYTLKMVYAITEADDPNMLEKIFSSVSKTREIKLSYGDWNAPGYIYKEETAIITKVSSNVDFKSSKINYTIKCTSTALSLQAGTFSFPSRTAKPSDVLVSLLNNEAYGLKSIFSGMTNSTKNSFDGFISRDDKTVTIEAKDSVNILEYMSYLVSCMIPQNDTSSTKATGKYYWAVFDDTNNEYGGSYFKVVKADSNVQYNLSYNTYEVDVGYPSGNYVTDFTVSTDNTWAILYEYSNDIQLPQYTYTIDNNGDLVSVESPALTKSSKYMKTTPADLSWWANMTLFPINAKITIQGLLRPTLLMSYLKVNTFFYGHKHVSSGLYIITKQEDVIDSQGYRTTLSLTRISGDEYYV